MEGFGVVLWVVVDVVGKCVVLLGGGVVVYVIDDVVVYYWCGEVGYY